MADLGERMPVRLVKENGDTISLDATSVDIVVERMQSNFGIPFFNASKMGIDLNQSVVAVEIQGVLADDVGQETTAQATALLDFNQPQQAFGSGATTIGSGGGTSGFVTSTFNSGSGISTNVSIGGGAFGGGSYSGGIGSAPVAVETPALGNRVLQHWHAKHISLPVSYWVEKAASLDQPITTGIQMWLKADSLSATLSDGDDVVTWSDASGFGRSPVNSTGSSEPIYKENGAGGQPYVKFVGGGGGDFLEYAYDSANSPFLNPDEFTIFAVASGPEGSVIDAVVSSRNNNDGYTLKMGSSAFGVLHHSSTYTNATVVGLTAAGRYPVLMAATFEDSADGGTLADTVALYADGIEILAPAGSKTYSKNTSGGFKIGTDGTNHLTGEISEILLYNRVLSISERQEVEGYLSRKYGTTLPSTHPYSGQSFSYQNKTIKVAFDKEMVGSSKEPYGFTNSYRRHTGLKIATGGMGGSNGDQIRTLTLDSFSNSYGVTTVTNGPRAWFEFAEASRSMSVAFLKADGSFVGGGSPLRGLITAVGSDSITVRLSRRSVFPSVADKIVIFRELYYGKGYAIISNPTSPVIIIPIKNADTFEEDALADKAVGPEFPAHQDGSTRDSGGGITRTDAYIAYLVSKALTSPYIKSTDYAAGGRPFNAAGDLTMDKCFSITIGSSPTNSSASSKLTITQQHASSLGALANTIDTDLGLSQMPVIEGFSGGKSGKKVKSGGDKAQDLLGILANSNNFGKSKEDGNALFTTMATVAEIHSHAVQDVWYSDRGIAGDYIEGIQIPYNTLITRGKSNLDAEVAQRNFFLSVTKTTGSKMASANTIHASRIFSSVDAGYLKNGIKGMVTDFNVHRDAEMKAYDFSIKFVAADIIL